MRIEIRKITIVFVVLTMSLLISAYSFKTYSMNNLKEKLSGAIATDEDFSPSNYLSLDKLPKDYGWQLAAKNGDVVARWDVAFNFEKMDKFYKAYQQKTLRAGDMIRIAIYTFEGDPLIKDLIFTGDGFDLIIDDTRISYQSEGIVKSKVSSIFAEPNGKYTRYYAKTNTHKEIRLI
jgi:hypothetical protein